MRQQNSESPVHEAFGLSHASWFIVPRVVLEAMPIDWQQRFIDLIDQLNEKYDWEPDLIISVNFRDANGRFYEIPECFNNYRRPDRKWLMSLNPKKESVGESCSGKNTPSSA